MAKDRLQQLAYKVPALNVNFSSLNLGFLGRPER